MAVCRIEKKRNYTRMSNYHLRDRNLSNKARGLLSTMLSLPDNWDYTVRGLAAICKDGVDGITAQLRELAQCGYLVRRVVRDSSGRIRDTKYIIYEEPRRPSPCTEKPDAVLSCTAEPCPEKPAERNTDQRIPEKEKTKEKMIESFPPGKACPKAEEERWKDANVQERNEYRMLVRENIEYDLLREELPFEKERLEEVLELIVGTLCSTKRYIRVAGTDCPAEEVRERLLSLDREHIRYVFECLRDNTSKIRSIRRYLLTALYNAPVTIGSYYAAQVRHDLSEGDASDS